MRTKMTMEMSKEEIEELFKIEPPKPWWDDDTVFYNEYGEPYTFKQFHEEINAIAGLSFPS